MDFPKKVDSADYFRREVDNPVLRTGIFASY
jgi:hypothetical protein